MVPIRPGTDGALLLLALVHEIIALGLYDRDFLARYTNAGQLVNQDEASTSSASCCATPKATSSTRSGPTGFYWWDPALPAPVADHTEGADPALLGRFSPADGIARRARLPAARRTGARVHPEWAAEITGIPAATIRRLAREMGITARDQKIELPVRWTDCWGRSTTPSPATRWPSAMRGLVRTATASRASARWRS